MRLPRQHERVEAPGRRPWQHGRWRPEHRQVRRRFMFLHLLLAFGALAFTVLGAIVVMGAVVTRLVIGGAELPALGWIVGAALTVTLPLVGWGLATRAFRRIARPMADVMDAADAIADGKLNVRVPEDSSGDFGRLARTFNRMAGELERTDELRRNLTADVAHELRTPLHIIRGNLEGILDGVYQPTPEQIGAILDETRGLGRLIEDLRTLSLAEAGRLPLQKELVSVGEFVDDLHTSFSGQAEAEGINLKVEADPSASGAVIVVDVMRLHQVLANLVVNALRHTSAGGNITLGAELVEGGLCLFVRDTGEGIAPEDLPHIFDRFWKGNSARCGPDNGSGLGLAIARELVELHGGAITVESQPGGGTLFTICLPLGA